jgi:hypothetical protein
LGEPPRMRRRDGDIAERRDCRIAEREGSGTFALSFL